MFAFWALAVLLCVAAAVFVLLPLLSPRSKRSPGNLQRDALNVALFEERLQDLSERQDATADEQDQRTAEEHEALVVEAKRDLLSDTRDEEDSEPGSRRSRAPLLLSALLVPVIAVVLYAEWGLSRGAIVDHELARRIMQGSPSDPDYRKLVAEFADYAREREGAESRYVLAGAYLRLGEHDKAVDVYRKLTDEFPEDANLAAAYASALFAQAGNRPTLAVAQAATRTLALNPEDTDMMELSAIAAMRTGQNDIALDWLRRILATGVAPERAEMIRHVMSELAGDGDSADAPPGRMVTVEVSADDAVQLSPESAVFVYAIAANGPPAPLAVQRLTLADLPTSVRLSEGDAMLPGMSLGDFDQIVVVARVSSTGAVAPSPGDFEARSAPIQLGETNPDNQAPAVTLQVQERLGE